MESELTRSFICIEVPDEIVKEVARIQEVLAGWKFNGKMTELENLHLTLKFLGELDHTKLAEVEKRLATVAFSSFKVTLQEVGTFNVRGQPKIVWIKLGGKGIFELQKKIDNALQDLFKSEERFMSHLTIARVRYVKDAVGFVKHIRSLKAKELSFETDRFYLKKSVLMSPGPVYSTLAHFNLDGENILKKEKKSL